MSGRSTVFASLPAADAKRRLCLRTHLRPGEHQVPYFICSIDLVLLESFDARRHEEMTNCNLIDSAQSGADVDWARCDRRTSSVCLSKKKNVRKQYACDNIINALAPFNASLMSADLVWK